MNELVQPCGFGPFYCGAAEILRRIFVTVRDRHWNEISPTQWGCRVDEAAHLTTVRSRHVSDLVDFEWQGTLNVSAGGCVVKFAFEGEARRTMDVCRLGLVVLHPVETMLGAKLCARTHESQQTQIISCAIAPQPIVDEVPRAMTQPFSSLRIERADFGLLDLHFDGDLFEIEDQRNWGDASFKTYCTPLRLGFPRQVEMGTRIAHRLEVSYTPALPSASFAPTPSRTRPYVLPTVGRVRQESGASASDELAWHHLHVDLCDSDNPENVLRTLGERETPCLELGVDERHIDIRWPRVVSWIAENARRVARLLLYGTGASPPSPASIESWRRILDAAGVAELPVLAATHGYFVEFNRSTGPQPLFAAGIAFPLSATAHADDAMTIAENVATIRDIADTARLLTSSRDFAIAPLALCYPSLPAPRFPPAMIAPWFVATMLSAASAGVGSITLAEDVASTVPTSLLDSLLRCAGQTVTVLNEQPKGLYCALLTKPAQSVGYIFGVNLGGSPSRLELKSVAPRVRSLLDMSDGRSVKVEPSDVGIRGFAVRWLVCELNQSGD